VLGRHQALELAGVEEEAVALDALIDRHAVAQVSLHPPPASGAGEIVTRLPALIAFAHRAHHNRLAKELRKAD